MTGASYPIVLGMLAGLAGIVAGWLHFSSLHRVAEGIVDSRLSAVGFQIARLLVLGLFLYVCSRGGALPLITAAAGIMIGRALVLRRAR